MAAHDIDSMPEDDQPNGTPLEPADSSTPKTDASFSNDANHENTTADSPSAEPAADAEADFESPAPVTQTATVPVPFQRGGDVPFNSGDSLDEIELPVEASQPFVGMWHQLVSRTNWDKGEIILKWRESLVEDGAPPTSYSDEAWAQMVGGVTSQHVGRLRRVFQRFAASYQDYSGLYWSHFQAGLDWDDAELWLEGAVQNKWSVSQMRKQRWETLGADPSLKPDERDVIVADVDEDYEPLRNHEDESGEGSKENSAGPRYEGPDFGDETEMAGDSRGGGVDVDNVALDDGDGATANAPAVRPFENLSELPEDVADAFDSFKLSIIRHRNAGWTDITCEQMLASLDALKELAKLPPAVEDAD